MPDFFLSAARTDAKRKAVEIGDKPIKAVIVRDGEEIRNPQVDTKRIGDFIDQLKPIDRQATPRLVQQSVPAGTFVAAGTPVDLTFVRPTDITVGILEGAHSGMRAKTVEELIAVMDRDSAVKEIVRKGDASKLTEAERSRMQGVLEEQGIQLDESQADLTFDKAYETFVSVRAFQ